MNEQRNMILAVVLAIIIIFGFDYIFGYFNPPPPPQQQVQTGAPNSAVPGQPAPPGGAIAPGVPGAPSAPAPILLERKREDILKDVTRVKISSPRLHGSIALKGARIDDLTLANYRETLDPKSKEIPLTSPLGSTNPYFAEWGWTAQGVKVPTGETIWGATSDTLTPDQPITLVWDNGEGLVFKRTISMDENYMFTVKQTVENNGPATVTLYPYALISRTGTPELTGFIILHEGPFGVFDGTLEEVDYEDLRDDGNLKRKSIGGWIGITDKYWMTAVIPDQKAAINADFIHSRDGNNDKYQVDYVAGGVTIAPGGTGSTQGFLFAGAKEVTLMDHYTETLGITNFDLAIDFGVLYFLTKPIFYCLLYINNWFGNFGVAIILLTLAIKLLMFPLANKSYRAMGKMKTLQPKMEKLRERFGDDKARLNQEMMALYKREKANPASGCLPLFVQIPVFFALYKVLFVNIEMRHAPFFGWIQDLSAPDPTSIFNLFGLIPWTPPELLMIGVWPLIMGVSMFLQQKLNPQPADPVQAKIMMALPIVFTFMLGRFPAGLVIYWACNNVLSIAQQWVIMRQAAAATEKK